MARQSRKARGPGRPTPKEIRHRKRSREQQRTLLFGTGGVIVVIVLILGFGYYRENIAAPRAPVAVVNGQGISIQAYQQMVKYQRFNLISRLGSQIDQATLVNFLQDQLPQSVLSSMIDQVLIEQYAAEQGITVTDKEVQQTIEQQFGFTADAPTPTPSAGEAITATQSASSVTREQFNTAFSSYLDTLKTQTGISESEFRAIVRGELLQNKVLEQITADVPTSAQQVHARHILVKTEEEAKQVRQRLLDGEDFAKVAEEVSTDTASAKNGGDLGWFGLGQMDPEFEKEAFNLPIGKISDPVKTQFGYHIIEVLERDENRPLSPSQLDQAKQERYQKWLEEQRGVSDIQRHWTPDVVPPLPEGLASSQPTLPPPVTPSP